MRKNTYKHRFIADSSKSSTKPLSSLLTKLLTRSPEVLRDSLLKEWDQSDVNPLNFKRTIRSS